MIDSISQISVIFDLVTKYASGMDGKLSSAGLSLLSILAVIQFSWVSFHKFLGEGGVQEIVAEVMMLTLKVGMIAWLIKDLGNISQQVLAGFDWIASQLTGVGNAKNMSDIMFKSLGKISSEIWDGMSAAEDRSWWEAIRDTVAGMGSFWIKILILLIFLTTTVIALAIFFWSQIQVLIAIAILPIFLPFYIIPLTSKWADGLMDFFFKSAAMKMVAIIMMSICIKILEGSNAAVAAATADKMTLDLLGMTVLLFVALMILFLMLQVPNLTNAMFSGQTVGLSRIMPSGMAGLKNIATGGGGKNLPTPTKPPTTPPKPPPKS